MAVADPLETWAAVRRAVAERCGPRAVASGWNPMGVPAGLGAWLELLDELGLGAGPWEFGNQVVADALSALVPDCQLAEATGRWTLTRAPRREPASYVPGDVVALRSLYAMHLLLDPDRAKVFARDPTRAITLCHDAVPTVRALVEAEAYWLPAGSEEAVLASEPPSPDQLAAIRLRRQRSVVWLAHPAEVPAGVTPAGLLVDLQADVNRFDTTELQVPMPVISAVTMLDGLAENPRTARLEGMVLFADDDGALADGLAWLVQVPSIIDGVAERGIVLGRRSLADWRAVAEMMSAIVAWGDWTEPGSIPMPARPGRDDLRRLRHGSTRRLEESGALAGVRVLDARRRAPSRHDEANGTHASPIPHPRRGYWRNQPVGPRDDGRREPRWIPPTWVNAAGAQRGPVRVYRLPAAPRAD